MANFCKKCGSPLSPGVKFCAKCGMRIAAVASAPAPAAMPYPAPAPKSSGGAAQWVIAALVVVAACGAGWYVWQDNAEKLKLSTSSAVASYQTASNPASVSNTTVPDRAEKSPATFSPKTDSPASPTNQGTPIQVLRTFHENITNKNYRKAYNCLSKDFQAAVSYEGWVPGFRTTVSSTVSDVKTVSKTSDQVVLTYTLIAVDNPGGTQYFHGTTILVKTSEGWKIDDITNKTL